jgi:AhpD family alkylhydroperoxidase
MPAIRLVETLEDAPDEVRELFDRIKKMFGIREIPATFQAMANKPAFLKVLLDMDEAVFADDCLDAKTKHLIAVAVSAASGCAYCTHAHSAVAQQLGASNEEVAEALAVAAVMGAYNNFNKATGLPLDIKP